MARARAVKVEDPTPGIIAEYRQALSAPAVKRETRWQPEAIGPSWRVDETGHWLLPPKTLGWEVLGWCGRWLQHGADKPWRFTLEQARWLLWWFAVDDAGQWVYRDGVLQRIKGWGKDPLGACLCMIELVGPCRFAEWGPDGQPLAADMPSAWVQTAAVSLEQTKNTTLLFQTLPTAEAREVFGLQVGKELVHAYGGERLIQAVTSSPTTLEGARATFLLLNETQHWDSSNGGHEMAATIARNAAKSADGAARTLRITNAYEPGGDSVAQRDREAYEAVVAGKAVDVGLLYDSLEAPAAAPLSAEEAPSVVDAVRGDSYWLNMGRIVQEILDVRNSPSTSRRFWYNQIVASEDAWLSPQEWDACADPGHEVLDGAQITLGFDGSKNDDDTALVACEVETGHIFALGIWHPEDGEPIDRLDVDGQVQAARERYDVVAFYSDVYPWESYVDRWAEDFGDQLLVKATTRQPVAWDMRGRGKEFTHALERYRKAIVDSAAEAQRATLEGRAPGRRFTHSGHPLMRQHHHNARRAVNPWGVTVRKEGRESPKKIDSVPAATLAFLARQEFLALPASRRRRPKQRSGVIWGAY